VGGGGGEICLSNSEEMLNRGCSRSRLAEECLVQRVKK
jgi:hypothetical protein